MDRRTFLRRVTGVSAGVSAGVVIAPLVAPKLPQWLAWLFRRREPCFDHLVMPLIRSTMPCNPIVELCTVQPMTRKHGQVFFMHYQYGKRDL